MKYQIPQTVFIQEIDDEVILLDTTTQEYFSLNEVGKNIIDLISENLTKDQIVEELSNIYEVDKIQIEKDCTYMSQENPYYIKITEKCSI